MYFSDLQWLFLTSWISQWQWMYMYSPPSWSFNISTFILFFWRTTCLQKTLDSLVRLIDVMSYMSTWCHIKFYYYLHHPAVGCITSIRHEECHIEAGMTSWGIPGESLRRWLTLTLRAWLRWFTGLICQSGTILTFLQILKPPTFSS